jgi:hypothetical protein
MENKNPLYVFGKRRTGYKFSHLLRLCNSLKSGESTLLVSLNNHYPKEEVNYLTENGIKFTVEANIVKPNVKIHYNWNGSVRSTEQPQTHQSGWIFKPMIYVGKIIPESELETQENIDKRIELNKKK